MVFFRNSLFALNIVGYPINDLPKETLTEILQGGADKAAEAGISIVGGHSVDDHEPKYGLVVTGEVHKNKLVRNNKDIKKILFKRTVKSIEYMLE